MSHKPIVCYGEMESPLGPLTVVSTNEGICKLQFGSVEETLPSIKAWAKKHFLKIEVGNDETILQDVYSQLNEYFIGEREQFDIPIDLYGTPFQQKVWNSLRSIEYAETNSYKEVAQAIGAPKAVRAIGSANNKNPVPIIIPCHRVIGSNGALVGYGGGLSKKEYLLQLEKNNAARLTS
ncbi:methylated-DNA--[protein]-cysteine S-methyltransferase [Bacillus taeanensis]|uniref:Methylated-DNA--protein-cysteine methyltransferase n=1 Tax=Bacillus taeanensis TaxID=273032 RepID=A0A366XSM3_9BACI|nr:methylated-DNA--[protein]-cysteine S-methyltransferase [Bacillus taeanensis]RBW69380.1 [Fe-S]-binding protein [Bacillus taeanensis]